MNRIMNHRMRRSGALAALALAISPMSALAQPSGPVGPPQVSPALSFADARAAFEVFTPMRDGVKLAGNVFLPPGTGRFR